MMFFGALIFPAANTARDIEAIKRWPFCFLTHFLAGISHSPFTIWIDDSIRGASFLEILATTPRERRELPSLKLTARP